MSSSLGSVLAVLLLVSSCSACDDEPEEVGGTCASMGLVVCACPDGTPSCGEGPENCDCPGQEPAPTEVDIPTDDDNRFVREDFDAFLEKYPDVVRESDAERMRTCLGDACLEGLSDSVGPFDDEGVRYLVPLWFRACLSGSGAGCLSVAQTYNGSAVGDHPVHEDMTRGQLDEKTMQYATRACELSEAHCRMWASETLSAEAPAEADVARAVALLRAECEAGGHHGCGSLGNESRAGRQVAAIGPAREWYEKACALEGEPPFNRYCDDYGRILYASGSRVDREEAARILAPICDVAAEAWASGCQGDAAAGTQQCTGFEIRFGESCAAYADTLEPADALPIFSVLCRAIAPGGEQSEAENTENCRKALRLARRTNRPDAFVENVLTRACDAVASSCEFEHEFDEEICGPVRARCMRDGP